MSSQVILKFIDGTPTHLLNHQTSRPFIVAILANWQLMQLLTTSILECVSSRVTSLTTFKTKLDVELSSNLHQWRDAGNLELV